MADRLLHALRHSAGRRYGGEPVTELVHSLQCADLALDFAQGPEAEP
jgi:predicted HD phosphohydrolase